MPDNLTKTKRNRWLIVAGVVTIALVIGLFVLYGGGGGGGGAGGGGGY